MAKTIWGRKETIVWPYQIPIYLYSAVFFSAFATFVFVCAWIRFGATPLERYYLPTYERTAIMSVFSKTHQSVYRVLFVASGKLPPRPAMNDDVTLGRTREADGKTIPLALSSSALQHTRPLYASGWPCGAAGIVRYRSAYPRRTWRMRPASRVAVSSRRT